MIERWQVNYLSSVGFLRLVMARSKMMQRKSYPLLVAAFANPDSSLSYATQEAKIVQDFVPTAEIYVESQATEELAVQKSRNCSVMIFATHCMANNQKPNYTHILLKRTSSYDGYWHVWEVENIKCPNMNLVVLSGCATAIGEQNPGLEVRNLVGAFSKAGASSIVATLWSINDLSTKELMSHFYRGIFKQKLSKIEALRQAQLKLLSNPRYRHPLAWAPFILYGDWQKLNPHEKKHGSKAVSNK